MASQDDDTKLILRLEPSALTLSKLTKLDLSINGIENEGAAHLAAALEKNTTLTTLNLRDNGIKFEGAARLVAALEKNRALTTLILGGNNIKAARVDPFFTPLEWFDFSENVGRDDLIRHWGGTPLKWQDMEGMHDINGMQVMQGMKDMKGIQDLKDMTGMKDIKGMKNMKDMKGMN